MAKAAADCNPFKIHLGELGAFPSLRTPRIIWVGITGHLGRLNSLRNSIETHIAKLGITREEGSFQPHLTLGRVHKSTPIRNFASNPRLITSGDKPAQTIHHIQLMRSELKPNGARYSVIETVKLGAKLSP